VITKDTTNGLLSRRWRDLFSVDVAETALNWGDSALARMEADELLGKVV
jgi:hypothetical protein